MASIRDLKSDVKYLISEVVSDCSNVIILHPEKKDEVSGLIDKAIDIFESSLNKINEGNGKGKAYFNGIRNEVIAAADEIFNKLGEIVGEK